MKEIKESSFLFRLYSGVTSDKNPKDFCNFSWIVIFILLTMPLSAPIFLIAWIISKMNGTRTLDELPPQWHNPFWNACKMVIAGFACYGLLSFIFLLVVAFIQYYVIGLKIIAVIIGVIIFLNSHHIYGIIKANLNTSVVTHEEPEEDDNSMGVFEMLSEKFKSFKEKRCPRIKIIRDEE